MTLVLGCLTPRFVVQVCDRRITEFDTGKLIDDDRNKATLFCTHVAYAYSGLAEVGGVPTDHWIAKTLSPFNSNREAYKALEQAATAEFQRFGRPSEITRHAFVGIGWSAQKNGPMIPAQLIMSNAFEVGGGWAPVARSSFQTFGVRISPSSRVRLCPPVGVVMRDDELSTLRKHLSRCERKKSGPWAFIRLLAEAVQRVAARNPAVGAGLLAMVMPPPPPEQNEFSIVTIVGPPTPTAFDALACPVFLNIPASTDDWSWAMPNLAGDGKCLVGARMTFDKQNPD